MLKENDHSNEPRTIKDQLSDKQDHEDILILWMDVLSKMNEKMKSQQV